MDVERLFKKHEWIIKNKARKLSGQYDDSRQIEYNDAYGIMSETFMICVSQCNFNNLNCPDFEKYLKTSMNNRILDIKRNLTAGKKLMDKRQKFTPDERDYAEEKPFDETRPEGVESDDGGDQHLVELLISMKKLLTAEELKYAELVVFSGDNLQHKEAMDEFGLTPREEKKLRDAVAEKLGPLLGR